MTYSVNPVGTLKTYTVKDNIDDAVKAAREWLSDPEQPEGFTIYRNGADGIPEAIVLRIGRTLLLERTRVELTPTEEERITEFC